MSFDADTYTSQATDAVTEERYHRAGRREGDRDGSLWHQTEAFGISRLKIVLYAC